MSNFYEKAKADFAGIQEEKITDELCDLYLANQRLANSAYRDFVPDGITAHLLQRFLIGEETQYQVMETISTAYRYVMLLESQKHKLEDMKNTENDAESRARAKGAYEAYGYAIDILPVPISYLHSMKLVDINRII